MTAPSRPAAPPRRRRARGPAVVRVWALAAVVVVGAALLGGSGPALADSTPAPTGTPGRPAVLPLPCPTGQTPTLVTSAPPAAPRPATTPDPTVTTRSDGSTVRPVCTIAPPVPFVGPVIAPENAVGGPLLAQAGVVVRPTDGSASVPAPPEVTDVSWVISDLATGEVLAAKDPHALLLPASTLKTLLCLVTLPTLKPTTVVRASAAAVGAEGTRVGLVPGAPYTVDQLFTGMILVSGNDTAYALAGAYGGTAKTLAAMNAKAAALGAWDTVAKDPSGLDAVGQRSSAYDLSLIGRAVMRLPQFRRYAVTADVAFPGGTDPQGKVYPPFRISNHNTLLENYPGTIGVKNGYTSGARHTFIGAATRGGRTLLITEMGGVVVPSWQPTAALLDWAFAHAAALTPVGTLVAPGAPQPPEWQGWPSGRPGTALPTGGATSGATSGGTYGVASGGTSGGTSDDPSDGTSGSTSGETTASGGKLPADGSGTSTPAPVAGSGAGGDPFPGALAAARTAVRSPAAYVIGLLLLAALAGWLLVRRRHRYPRAPTSGLG